jgi:mono/diheme cytochrome c family protein
MKSLLSKSVLLAVILCSSSFATAANLSEDEMITRGRYVVKVTGCNDCHTPKYGDRSGDVPENEWLIGTNIGYKGPWGTTYAQNLRHMLANKTEAQWVTYAKRMHAKPPMPWYNVNAMDEEDLKAMYQFIHSLGDNNNEVPKELPPGQTPKTPYINFEVITPID